MEDIKMDLSPELIDRLTKLEQKYQAMGQDLLSYLDGLLYADYLTYWDYVHLDVLLNLQNPRTSFPDEEVFIIYHQITELYFKLILSTQKQIAEHEDLTGAYFLVRMNRINRYFENLTRSFEIMIQGMEKEQFLKFRMSLLPASGFQSAQYRMIEIASTPVLNLLAYEQKGKLTANNTLEEIFDGFYWKQGATELSTGKKTLTLRQFEEKYTTPFLEFMEQYADKNMWLRFQQIQWEDGEEEKAIHQMRELDLNANVRWPLVHYKSAVHYLQKDPEDIAATGGTNWQKYMPPKNQRITFFPSLWSEEELKTWGTFTEHNAS